MTIIYKNFERQLNDMNLKLLKNNLMKFQFFINYKRTIFHAITFEFREKQYRV